MKISLGSTTYLHLVEKVHGKVQRISFKTKGKKEKKFKNTILIRECLIHIDKCK